MRPVTAPIAVTGSTYGHRGLAQMGPVIVPSIGTENERSAEKRTDIADESKKPAASNRAVRPRGCEPVVYILLATTM